MSTLNGDLRNRLRQELHGWLREDPDFRQWILNLTGSECTNRRETGSRFDRLLDEPRCNREVQERNWDEQNRKFDEKWVEQVAENHRLHEEVMAMADRLDCKIGTLGARWGLLIACEIKSSMDKAGLYIFSRKVDFYERKHQRKANRRLVITPFLDPRTAAIPEKLSIEVLYTDPTQIRVD